MKRSFYEMLEVSRKATQSEIDAAFEAMTAKLGATTSVRGTAESLTQLNMLREGYKILSDPEKRTMYDAKLYASDAGIKLMFFPKDTKAVKKLGFDTVMFAIVACVFTYVIYQKLVRVDPAPVDLTTSQSPKADAPKAGVKKVESPGTAVSPVEQPGKAASTTEPPNHLPDAKASGKSDVK